MAYHTLVAEFFVTQSGDVIQKAKPLKRKVARQIYIRDGGKCQACGTDVRFGGKDVSPYEIIASGHIDHIIPRSRGGQNDPSNLRLLCMSCNCQKGAH